MFSDPEYQLGYMDPVPDMTIVNCRQKAKQGNVFSNTVPLKASFIISILLFVC